MNFVLRQFQLPRQRRGKMASGGVQMFEYASEEKIIKAKIMYSRAMKKAKKKEIQEKFNFTFLFSFLLEIM